MCQAAKAARKKLKKGTFVKNLVRLVKKQLKLEPTFHVPQSIIDSQIARQGQDGNGYHCCNGPLLLVADIEEVLVDLYIKKAQIGQLMNAEEGPQFANLLIENQVYQLVDFKSKTMMPYANKEQKKVLRPKLWLLFLEKHKDKIQSIAGKIKDSTRKQCCA